MQSTKQDPSRRPFNPCDASPERETLPAKIWELLRRNSGFKKTVARLKELRRRLPSQNQKVKRSKQSSQPSIKGISSTHQIIRQILTNLSQRNKYAFTALEWIFPDLRLRRRTKLGSRAKLTLVTSWAKAPNGFKQEFRSLCADLDKEAKLPIGKEPSLHPTTHKVTFLDSFRLTEMLSKIAANGRVTGDQFMYAMRIDDLAKQYHLFAVPKTLIHRGEATAIARWIENELKTGLPNKRDLLGNPQEWKNWLSKSPGRKTSEYYDRIRYLNQLCREIFPNLKHSDLLAPAAHRSHRKHTTPKRGN